MWRYKVNNLHTLEAEAEQVFSQYMAALKEQLPVEELDILESKLHKVLSELNKEAKAQLIFD